MEFALKRGLNLKQKQIKIIIDEPRGVETLFMNEA